MEPNKQNVKVAKRVIH